MLKNQNNKKNIKQNKINNNFNLGQNVNNDNFFGFNNNINNNNFNLGQNLNYNQFNQQQEVNEIKNNEDESEEKEEDEKEKELNKKKCSTNGHKEIDAIIYCQECKINMCDKCEKIHSNTILLKNHHTYSLDKNPKDIFTGLCLKPEHTLALNIIVKPIMNFVAQHALQKLRKKEMENIKIVWFIIYPK